LAGALHTADEESDPGSVSAFHRSAEIARKAPKMLITDGLKSYRDAYVKEYQTNHGHSRTLHIREIRLAGKVHNNKVERMNAEIRDRENPFRGLKRTDSPILKGLQIYHNFIGPHEGLGGDTPADRVGINVEGENKWLTIIQNASKRVGEP